MTKTQDQIDTERDAMRLLQKLLQFQEGLVWTPMIFAEKLNWDKGRVDKALKWLIKREYIHERLGSYSRTEAGREYYESARKNPTMNVNTHAWRDEALTGVKNGNGKRRDGDWQRSEIENGVVPKSSILVNHLDTPEQALLKCEENKLLKKLEAKAAKKLGLKLKDFRDLFQKGLIKLCKGTGKGAHLGRFHRKGNGTQHLCVECRKGQRK